MSVSPESFPEPIAPVSKPGSCTEITAGLSCAKLTLTVTGLFVFLNEIDCPITGMVAGRQYHDFPAYIHRALR